MQARHAATFAAALLAAAGAEAAAPAAPNGFGNIPFGASKDKALELNAGNGTLSNNPDKTATLSYSIMIAGLTFAVVQNFDIDGKATDANLTYNSREDMQACIDRLNFVLEHLNKRYGKPTVPMVTRHEDAGSTRTDLYTFQYAFANRAGIKAEAQAIYPLPPKPGAGGNAGAPAPAPAAGGGTSSCRVSLQYLPPLWIAHF